MVHGPAFAAPAPSAGAAIAASQNAAAAAQKTAAAAAARARVDSTRAAMLTEREVAAAASLRRLEDATAADEAGLALLSQNAATARLRLRAGTAALATMLPVMQRLSTQPGPILLAAPGPPADAVRGVLILQGIAAGIEAQARQVRAESAQLDTLMAEKRAAIASLFAAAARQNDAEAALSRQIAAARVLAAADTNAALAAAAAAIAADKRTKTLEQVVARLAGPADHAPPLQMPGGENSAPVAGAVVQNFGDDTAAGPAEGVSYRAAPGARVAAPCAGPVRFAGPFATYGQLVILDCGAPYMFVLSGMTHLDVAAGQNLARGQPVGEMRAFDPHDPASQPVLYVELRQNGRAVDPGNWPGAAR